MRSSAPTKYHELPPFETLFKEGVPVLMYHKIAKRPGGVRLKGLYVSPDRFEQQLEEFKSAGFQSLSLSDIRKEENAGKKLVVFSFDDGFRNVLQNATGPFCQRWFLSIQIL